MVDIFALVLAHGLLALAAWRLLWRRELDQEGSGQERIGAGPPRRRAMRWPAANGRSDSAGGHDPAGGPDPAGGGGHA
ncbi:hypothetical protein [Novosphingobium clariflavum]|uniref:Uncharacterized protein n=1 Tax=Novosphingobium clariflavum TaxID=2029884 RepID=A0ABV6S5F8_9SPHN|nr:hypothetical protein [Novosphingobium clariflavum]